MTTTPKFGIPLISGQQNQPEVTHNQMVVVMQALAGGAIAEQNAPPGSPTEGDCYIVGAIPTGAWSGHAHAIAIYFGGWLFVPGFDNDGVIIPMTAAQNGLSIFNNDTTELWAWQTSSWIVVTGGTGASRLIDLLDVLVSETGTENGDALVWNESAGKWIARELSLSNLVDVQVTETSTIDGDVLAWDDAAQAWVPMAISIPSEGAQALKDLTDVHVGESALEDGDFLVWDNAILKWVAMPINFPSEGVPNLSDLPDVHIVSPVDGDVLTYDGVTHKWIAEPGGAPITSSGAGSDPAPTMTKLTAVGSGNYFPPDGCTRIEVDMKGSGAGGIGTGTAGTITAGLGADAIFNGYHAAGGLNSAANFPSMGGTGGADGVGAAWAISYPGETGQAVSLVPWSATTYAMYGGNGGGSGAGRTSINANDGIAAIANSGAGGGAAGFGPDTLGNVAANLSYGGGGSEAERRVLQFNHPKGPIAYTIPDGGAGGAAGTGGHAGGKGGSGRIYIKEFYD